MNCDVLKSCEVFIKKYFIVGNVMNDFWKDYFNLYIVYL